MSFKLTFIFGLLLASGWTQEQVLEPEKVLEPENVSEPVKAKAEVKLDDLEIDNENLNKKVDEKVEKTGNDVKASARASSSFNFNFEELLAKLFKAVQQNKETNKEQLDSENAVNNEEVENNLPNKENPEEDVKFPFNYYFNVHARPSASAKSTSSFYFDYPKDEENNEDGITKVQEEPQENVEVNNEGANVEEKSENEEQLSDAENVKVEEHCNQQNSKNKELLVNKPSVEEPIKTEDETQVEEKEQQ